MKHSSEGISGPVLARLKSALDEAAIVAITDKNGVITYVNKKFCTISKFSSEELVGKTHSVVNSGFHSKEFFNEMWQTISSGRTWEGEIRNRAKDKSYYWVHTTIVPFVDEFGKIEQYVAVRYEITERKLAEEQLRVYAKKLEVSNQELQEFASVAAHDLQEPLRKIQAFSDRLKTKAADQLAPESQDYLQRIQNSALRMQVLINDLLSYSRVTTKARPFENISLQKILAQVTSDLEVQIERCHGRVTWGDLPSIKADPVQMHQLFQNLISNALKFSKTGQQPVVKIDAEISNSECVVTIQDNGIGFDEKYLDRIFTIFQRLHGRHEYEGTGIGLAICRKIVERHGGHLTAKSEIDKGARFIIHLPFKKNGELNNEI